MLIHSVISRLMFLTSSSGIRQDDFGKLATDAESLIENIVSLRHRILFHD
jgi:hypothetical protein